MKTEELKHKLHAYIDSAEDKKLEALYTVLEGDIDHAVYDWQKDEEWLAELDNREAESLRDDVKTYSLDEVESFVSQAIKKTVVAK